MATFNSKAQFFLLLLLLGCAARNRAEDEDGALILSGRRLHQQQLSFPNQSLRNAYIALQSWKQAITGDPQGITTSWVGADVCSYKGVFCSSPPDDSCEKVVSGIDLNHGYLSGTLPEELGLLTYLALFHINTNFFCGTIPDSFINLELLFELDVSNNRFSGRFPLVTLALPSLAYLDIRFNKFEGELPAGLFEKHLDALFVNSNNFKNQLPWNLGGSTVSVANFANNFFVGGIPPSIGNMGQTLNEILFLNNSFDGCIPDSVGFLQQVTVLDTGLNRLGGTLPLSISKMISLEQLNVANNLISGQVPALICDLPNLSNFTFSNNFFNQESLDCIARRFDNRLNCIPTQPFQRPVQQCQSFLTQQTSCFPLPPPEALASPISPSLPYTYSSPPPPPSY